MVFEFFLGIGSALLFVAGAALFTAAVVPGLPLYGSIGLGLMAGTFGSWMSLLVRKVAV